MRSTTLALATIALTGFVGGTILSTGAAYADAAPTKTERERGVVLECTGRAHGLAAYVDLYENDVYGNTVQVILNDNPRTAKTIQPEENFLVHGEISSVLKIKHRRLTITGSAIERGRKTHVHEVHHDAGNRIVADGTHRRLENDLTLAWGSKSVPLTCGPAFAYDLTVKTTSTVED